jgi:uncharacterized protein
MSRFPTALLFTVVAFAGACDGNAPPSTKRVIRLVNDGNLSESLARELNRTLPNVEVRLTDFDGVGSYLTLDALERGEAEFGFALADVAYFSYAGADDDSTRERSQIRGMAALPVTPVHLLAGPGVTIRDVRDLRDLRVSTGAEFSQLSRLADLILRAYGLEGDSPRRGPLATSVASAALVNGTIDAAFVIGYYPSPWAQAATKAGARLVPIDGPPAERLRSEYPFVRAVRIPAHTYPGQPEAVRTLGLDRLLICRSDLDEHLVHDLTEQSLAALPRLASTLGTSLRLMDLDQASAMPIPLHRGAALHYRERELSR